MAPGVAWVCALALGYDKKAMLVGYEPAMDAGYEIKLCNEKKYLLAGFLLKFVDHY